MKEEKKKEPKNQTPRTEDPPVPNRARTEMKQAPGEKKPPRECPSA